MKLKYIVMPTLIILIGGLAFSKILNLKKWEMLPYKPGKSYKVEWKQIDSLLNLGQAETALKDIDALLVKAKQENNHAQIIKAILYHVGHNNYEESNEINNIAFIEKEIATAAFPVKPILQNIVAQKHWQYYQSHRYEILERTATQNFNNTDIETWDARQFIAKTTALFETSLSNADSLKRVNLAVFDSILVLQNGSKNFRPTLYDFLAHHVLDFYINDEAGITKPSNNFIIDKEQVFAPTSSFIQFRVTTTDTLSFHYKALVLFRQLLNFRLEDENINALVDVELKRFKFLRQQAAIVAKDSLYLQALLQLEKEYPNDTITATTGHEIAAYYYEKSNEKNAAKNFAETALKKCESIIARFAKTRGAQNCETLKKQILQPDLSIQVEQVNVINKPFLALVNYKNINKLYLKIIKADDELERMNDRYEQEKFIKKISEKKAVTTWQQILPESKNYTNQSTEIKINALPSGKYYLVASPKESTMKDSAKVVYVKFWVSDISFITKNTSSGDLEIFVLNRTTSQTIANAQVKVYSERYNYNKRENEYTLKGTYKANQEGYLLIKGNNDYDNFKLEIIDKNDRLDLRDYFYTSRDYADNKPDERLFFFTDRAIYRPGQIVYFKGLLLEVFKKQNKILPGKIINVVLRDVNWQVVKEQKFTTNEYGSIQGNYTLPSSGLNGRYTLSAEDLGSINIQVEDYKRPKFQVQFQPAKGSFLVNEMIDVKGSAQMYAGSNVDNAKVQYRIVRNARYPMWCGWWWRERLPVSDEQEIISGETTTDEKGNFSVRFKAIPDYALDKKTQPIFTYTIYADVTDINGETRSNETTISVGYVALEANVLFNETILNNEALRAKIVTQNLNGEKENAEGVITIHQLNAPDKLIRKKLWQQPSMPFLKAAEYEKDFPLDAYEPKQDFSTWTKGKEVVKRNFNSARDSTWILKEVVTWQQGAYKLELLTKDAFGNIVKAEKYFTVLATQNKQMPYAVYNYFFAEKSTGEPGEKIKLHLGSAAKEVKVLCDIAQDNKVISRKWLTLNNEKTFIEIPIEEKHRGGFQINFTFVKDNRSYHIAQAVQVPYSNKDLTVSWETFRDKLAPGQKEQWKLKLSGSKGEKVAAELLAGMYDASLDALMPHQWNFSIWNQYGSYTNAWQVQHGFIALTSTKLFGDYYYDEPILKQYQFQQYDELNWFGGYYGKQYGILRTSTKMAGIAMESANYKLDNIESKKSNNEKEEVTPDEISEGDKAFSGGKNETQTLLAQASTVNLDNVKVRTNLQELAFFFPDLETDAEGNIIIAFTVPESLTKWKLMGFAHTKELQSVVFNKETVTQKDLMVFPNAPRFLREGDKITFTAKVSNLSEKNISGKAKLTLLDATTLKPINEALSNVQPEIAFTVESGESAPLAWDIKIPAGIDAVAYRITAAAANFTDGEESTLPVLSNRMMVTETLPLWIKSNQIKTFKLNSLLNAASTGKSGGVLTLEFTSQPAWYAVQALPYLMEYPYDCAEQTFSRLYANSLATNIVNSNPKVKTIFDRWKNSNALLSNLSKNEELKNILLAETPWVLDAQNEAEQKKRITLLFDLNTMSRQTENTINKLEKMQLPNGGFPWFSGMRDNEYITLYILTGLGKLDKLNVIQLKENNRYKQIVLKATRYCDDSMKKSYEELKKNKANMDEQQIGYMEIQYLYARSFMNKYVELPSSHKEAYNYYMQQAEKYWNKQNQYMKGMIALALHRAGNVKTPPLIMRSLNETAIKNEELGMYWKDMAKGYYWYQAPVETQALMIEAFNEVSKDETAVDELRVWLLKNKQTNAWSNSKATADACYSLLLSGTNWLSSDALVDITLGKISVIKDGKLSALSDENTNGIEPGTGYFKTKWTKNEIKPEMGNVTITKKDKGASWGALYWQYLEQLDKITASATPLQLKKQLFLQQNTGSGKSISPVNANTNLKPGDLLVVRIELRVDRDMEYVHMKDMRASGLEPVNVISQYKWQGNLGYYESTRDAATHFFFDYLPKGTYVFEYPLRISHKGNFSNGITNIQCMYAPEFASHSEGVRVRVE